MSDRLLKSLTTYPPDRPTIVAMGFYDNPSDANGGQRIVSNAEYDTAQLPLRIRQYCQAVGFASLAHTRYQNTVNCDLVPARVAALWADMLADTWTPGARSTEPAAPTLFQQAIAECYGKTPEFIRDRMETDMRADPASSDGLYRDAKGRTHKLWDTAFVRKQESHPAVKAVLARLYAERAKFLAAEAKAKPTHEPASLADLFADEPPTAAAAE